MYKEVRENMQPYPTKYGGYVWLPEEQPEYKEYLGVMPPKVEAVPQKINNKWFWIYGDNSKKQES